MILLVKTTFVHEFVGDSTSRFSNYIYWATAFLYTNFQKVFLNPTRISPIPLKYSILPFCETRTKRVLKFKGRNLDSPPVPPTDVTDIFTQWPRIESIAPPPPTDVTDILLMIPNWAQYPSLRPPLTDVINILLNDPELAQYPCLRPSPSQTWQTFYSMTPNWAQYPSLCLSPSQTWQTLYSMTSQILWIPLPGP